MVAPSHPVCLPGPISQDELPAQTLWVAPKRRDLALSFMKFRRVALALVPKVTHPFSQVLPASPALWQLPASLLHKGPIGNIELGQPQDGPLRDNLLAHHRSSSWLSLPWQGSPVRALPITPASLAWEEQITLHWYQIRFVRVSWLHLFARFGGAHVRELGCGPCHVLRDPGPCSACREGGTAAQPAAGERSSHPGIGENLPSSSCASKRCHI